MEFFHLFGISFNTFNENPWLLPVIGLAALCGVLDSLVNGSLKKTSQKRSAEQIQAQNKPPDECWLSKKPDGVVIGKVKDGRYFRVPVDKNAIYNGFIVGGAGAAKTTTLLMCTELVNAVSENPFTCLVVDPKREQYDTIPAANNLCLYPTHRDTWGWALYFALNNMQNASADIKIEEFGRIARSLLPVEDPKSSFWVHNAQDMLIGLLAAYYGKLDFIDAVNTVLACNLQDKIKELCEDASTSTVALKYLQKFVGKESEAMQDIETHLYTPLSIFSNSDVQYFFQSNPKKATPLSIINEGKSLYLCVPTHKLFELGSIFRLIICQTLDQLTKRPIGSNPCFVMIDEAYAIGKIDGIKEKLSIARGYGVSIWLSFQGLAQLRELYGKDGAQIIIDNCRIKCFLESSDLDTSSYVIKMAGTYRERKLSTTRGSKGSSTVSYQNSNIFEESDLQKLATKNREIVMTPTGTYQIHKNYWFRDRKIKKIQEELQKKYEERLLLEKGSDAL